MSATGKRFRVTVPLEDQKLGGAPTQVSPPEPLTLATADIVCVTRLPGGQSTEAVMSGETVARLIVATDPDTLDRDTIALELDGLAQLVGQLGGDEERPSAYFLELTLRAIARRVEAMSPDFSAHAYQVRAVEGGR